MPEIPDLNRRTYVGSLIAAGAIAAGAPAAISAGGDEDDENRQSNSASGDQGDQKDHSEQPDGIPAAHPFIGDLDGDDLSGDMEFDVENRYAGDQAVQKNNADEDRDWVVHYTTDGVETQDYPAALINLRERLDEDVKLDALADGELTFDYFVGKHHDQYIPGQAYLVIQTPKQKAKDKAWGLFKNVRRGGPRGQWSTLDVLEEMKGEGAPESGTWKALEIDIDPDGFRGEFESFSDAILEQAIQTRDSEGETFENVFGKYDDRKDDAILLAMGLGSGSSRTPAAADIYFDDYRIHVDDIDETFEIPAALRMDADFDSNGQITANLSFDVEPENVDLDDLDEDSVRLYPFSQIMPPLGQGVEPTQISANDEIEAQFPPGQVRTLDGLGGGEQRVVVAGRFDYDHVVWFYAVGTVDVPGN